MANSLILKYRECGEKCRQILQDEESRLLKQEEEDKYFNAIIEIEIDPDVDADDDGMYCEIENQHDDDQIVLDSNTIMKDQQKSLDSESHEELHDDENDLSGEWNGQFERFIDSEISKLEDDDQQAPKEEISNKRDNNEGTNVFKLSQMIG